MYEFTVVEHNEGGKCAGEKDQKERERERKLLVLQIRRKDSRNEA